MKIIRPIFFSFFFPVQPLCHSDFGLSLICFTTVTKYSGCVKHVVFNTLFERLAEEKTLWQTGES